MAPIEVEFKGKWADEVGEEPKAIIPEDELRTWQLGNRFSFSLHCFERVDITGLSGSITIRDTHLLLEDSAGGMLALEARELIKANSSHSVKLNGELVAQVKHIEPSK